MSIFAMYLMYWIINITLTGTVMVAEKESTATIFSMHKERLFEAFIGYSVIGAGVLVMIGIKTKNNACGNGIRCV